jgi:hypothetical protein
MLLILLIIVLVFGVGSAPVWPHSREWGYGPSGIIGVILLVLLLMMILGR